LSVPSGPATGTTPAAWIRARRLDAARRLLETTDLPVDQISDDCGFGNAVTLRQNFAAAFSTTPTEYRRRFDTRVGTSASYQSEAVRSEADDGYTSGEDAQAGVDDDVGRLAPPGVGNGRAGHEEEEP